MMNMKLVIGLTAPPLAGKETVSNILEELIKNDGHSVSRHRFSDILRETLALWDMPVDRDHLQPLAQWMAKFKHGALTHAVKSRLMKNPADVGILDGIRWFSDEAMVRELPKEGVKSVIIYITASADRRYARALKRQRHGEAGLTRAEFDRQDNAENETYIPQIGARADLTLVNEYDRIEDFHKEIAAMYKKSIRPLLR